MLKKVGEGWRILGKFEEVGESSRKLENVPESSSKVDLEIETLNLHNSALVPPPETLDPKLGSSLRALSASARHPCPQRSSNGSFACRASRESCQKLTSRALSRTGPAPRDREFLALFLMFSRFCWRDFKPQKLLLFGGFKIQLVVKMQYPWVLHVYKIMYFEASDK